MKLMKILDFLGMLFIVITSPILKLLGDKRYNLSLTNSMSDRFGTYVLTDHYYNPVYSEDSLPANTVGERDLVGLDLNEELQLSMLEQFDVADELLSFPDEKPADSIFGYTNPMYSYGDAESYYAMIRSQKPKKIIEIGSGNSTLICIEAIKRNKLDDPDYNCRVICIEPFEMPWLENTGVEVIRERVEHVQAELFQSLDSGDFLFIDSSHIIRPFGDVLTEFHHIIPMLSDGVFVHIDDIFTPRDYPERWIRGQMRMWNEQYLLESFLTYNDKFEIVLATNWLKHNHWTASQKAFPKLAENPGHEPGAFWFRRKP